MVVASVNAFAGFVVESCAAICSVVVWTDQDREADERTVRDIEADDVRECRELLSLRS